MRTLLLFRHGKTERESPRGDKERALTKRGVRDSEAMARHVNGVAPRPDAIIASNARRAQQTAAIVAAVLGLESAVRTDPEIYYASRDTLVRIVRNLPDAEQCVLLVGHNPGFEELTDHLTEGGSDGPHLPTAGVAYLEFDVKRWKDVREGTGRLRGLFDPETLPSRE